MNMNPMELTDEALKAVSGGSHEDQRIIEAKKLQEKLDGKTVQVTLACRVTVKEVAAAIKQQLGVDIERRNIEMPEIRKTGTYNFKLKIATGIVAKMAVLVI